MEYFEPTLSVWLIASCHPVQYKRLLLRPQSLSRKFSPGGPPGPLQPKERRARVPLRAAWQLHTYTHTYMHTYIHTHIHAYIPTYIHTYTHAYLHKPRRAFALLDFFFISLNQSVTEQITILDLN